MSSWIRKLLGSEGPVAAVRQTLEAARAGEVPVEIVSATGETAETVVEALLSDGFVIARPTRAGAGRALGRFEHLTIRFLGPRGLVTGKARVQGRFRLKGEQGRELLGYKLDYPTVLNVQTTRRDLERVFGADAVQEATLRVVSHQGLIMGLVDEITPTAAVLICRNADGHLKVGGEAVLRLELPRGGVIDDVVSISEVDARDDRCVVRVLFRHRQAAIASAIRAA